MIATIIERLKVPFKAKENGKRLEKVIQETESHIKTVNDVISSIEATLDGEDGWMLKVERKWDGKDRRGGRNAENTG